MTTRKYNMVAALTELSRYPRTFAALMTAVQNQFGATLDTMTAKQIAAVIDFGFNQHTSGMITAD